MGSTCVVTAPAEGRFSLLEMAGKGPAERLFGVISRSNRIEGKTLPEIFAKRLEERNRNTATSFDEYMKVRDSCWVLEQKDEDFYCDCPGGMKVRGIDNRPCVYCINCRESCVSTRLGCCTWWGI